MAKITLHGNPFNTCGELPEVGAVAPAFRGTDTALGEVDFPGDGAVVLNIFPSVDTPVRRALQAGLTALLLQEVDSPEAAASTALTNLRR